MTSTIRLHNTRMNPPGETPAGYPVRYAHRVKSSKAEPRT